ncbi:STY0301 family protein [Lichenicola sp.]|uniref:STY0301 family protein n=1 Tax=Lichenicola sp. TaxID=2804529 RepID=UPI003B001B14
MSPTRFVPVAMFLLLSCMGMAPNRCPQIVADHGKDHVLDNASLFDTPPVNKVDLEPAVRGRRDVWDLDRIDPYLVCRYSGTATVVTLHVIGARTCFASGPLFRAYCR